MAVTRRTHVINLSDSPWDVPWPKGAPPELQTKLNAALNGSERIVYMGPEQERSRKWLVVTEELIMGPA